MKKPDRIEKATRAALWVAWKTADRALRLVKDTDDQARYEMLSEIVMRLRAMSRGHTPVLPAKVDLRLLIRQTNGALSVSMIKGDTITYDTHTPMELERGSVLTGKAQGNLLIPGRDALIRMHGRADLTIELLDERPRFVTANVPERRDSLGRGHQR